MAGTAFFSDTSSDYRQIVCRSRRQIVRRIVQLQVVHVIMHMLRIVLIRPGSTDYDAEGRIQGTLDIPLNEQGDKEVLATHRRDPARRASKSSMPPHVEPAWQTAAGLADALDIKLKKLE